MEYKSELKFWADEQTALANAAKTAKAAAAAAAPRESVIAAARRLLREEDAKKAAVRTPEERRPVQRLGFDEKEAMRLGLALVYRGHNLVQQRPEEVVGTGLRLWDMQQLQSEFISNRLCSGCGQRGVLRASAMLEERRGLASLVRCWCVQCRRVTDEFATSRALPSEGKGRALMEVNARAYLGASQAGMGLASVQRFLGALDLHTPSKRCWHRVGKDVKAAMIEVGNASERRALLLERRLAFEASGGQLDADGRVGMGVSYDGAWLKPGTAYNSQEGIGSAIGTLSGQVVASGRRSKQCLRCKPGAPCGRADCNANHVGASGAMEPAIGAELVDKLNADGAAVFVHHLVTDLDAKVHKAVEAACAASGNATPSQLSDPNHVKKAAQKKMMTEVKKKVGRRGAFTKKVVDLLMRDVGAACNRAILLRLLQSYPFAPAAEL